MLATPFHLAKNGTPDGMAGFGRRKLERGIQLERTPEIGAALPLPPLHAAHEREIFVSRDLVLLATPGRERVLEIRRRLVVASVFVGLDAGRKLRLAFARFENALDVLDRPRGAG